MSDSASKKRHAQDTMKGMCSKTEEMLMHLDAHNMYSCLVHRACRALAHHLRPLARLILADINRRSFYSAGA